MNPSAPSPPRRQQPTVDAGRLWAGGAATAVVAALIALVGVLIGEGLFDVEMVHPPLLPIGDSFWLQYACTAALLALVATALAQLLATTTPRPRAFFGWVVGLATVVGVVLPFTRGRDPRRSGHHGARESRHRGVDPQPAVVGREPDAPLAPGADRSAPPVLRCWRGRRRTSRPVRRVLSTGALRPPDGRSSI